MHHLFRTGRLPLRRLTMWPVRLVQKSQRRSEWSTFSGESCLVRGKATKTLRNFSPASSSSLHTSARDIQDKTVGTLSQRISSQLLSLQGLQKHLEHIRDYLQKVVAGKLPMNHTILYLLQDIFNLLPNLHLEEFTRSFAVKTNDQLLVVYLASLIRSVLALHNLIGNKVSNREAERKDGEKGGVVAKKDGESKEGGDKKGATKKDGEKQAEGNKKTGAGGGGADKKEDASGKTKK